MSLFTELKRRMVVKVGGGYLVVAWLIAATGCFWPELSRSRMAQSDPKRSPPRRHGVVAKEPLTHEEVHKIGRAKVTD